MKKRRGTGRQKVAKKARPLSAKAPHSHSVKPTSSRKKSPSTLVPVKPSSHPAGVAVAAPEHRSSAHERTALPFSYNETRLTLLVRDPYWIYSYWDFSAETWRWIEALRAEHPNARPILRVHNVDQGHSFDLEIDLQAKNWYVHVGEPNTTFEMELGLLDPYGKFHRIARSGRVRTPRDSPSTVIDPEWDASNFDEIYRLSGGGQTGRGSELFSRLKKP